MTKSEFLIQRMEQNGFVSGKNQDGHKDKVRSWAFRDWFKGLTVSREDIKYSTTSVEELAYVFDSLDNAKRIRGFLAGTQGDEYRWQIMAVTITKAEIQEDVT